MKRLKKPKKTLTFAIGKRKIEWYSLSWQNKILAFFFLCVFFCPLFLLLFIISSPFILIKMIFWKKKVVKKRKVDNHGNETYSVKVTW